ncbi:MAG: hypothetical protein GY821_02800 [Gammaproteobacteria bacterium]|nr:hypothetical protein [Gammaproteobacteria bacterium]
MLQRNQNYSDKNTAYLNHIDYGLQPLAPLEHHLDADIMDIESDNEENDDFENIKQLSISEKNLIEAEQKIYKLEQENSELKKENASLKQSNKNLIKLVQKSELNAL